MQPADETPTDEIPVLTTDGLAQAMRDMPQRVIGVGPIHTQRPSRVFLTETTDLLTRMLPNLIDGEISNLNRVNPLYVPNALRNPQGRRTPSQTPEFLILANAIQTAAERARYR